MYVFTAHSTATARNGSMFPPLDANTSGSYENHITHLSGHNHEQVLNRNVIWYNIEDGRTNTRILHYNCIGEKKIIMNSGENTMPAPKINIIHGEKPV